MHPLSLNPAQYDAWYQSPRGSWIGGAEFRLMNRQLQPEFGATLLEVGCGTGHFTRQFAAAGLQATGLEPDPLAVDFARQQDGHIAYLQARAEKLPFADNSFDYCVAVTSLCFVDQPDVALSEMWRVSRKAIVLGLLNRKSLLYRQKHSRGSYRGARWDAPGDISALIQHLEPPYSSSKHGTAVFLPDGGRLAQGIERLLPAACLFGGFLSVCLTKNSRDHFNV